MATSLLRRGNSDLARDGVYTWSIPALTARSQVADGTVHTCPNAGVCAALCYARQGRYRFPNVLKSHTANLDAYLADPDGWRAQMVLELQARRFRPTGVPHLFDWDVRQDFAWWAYEGCRAVRIHDSGDFFSPAYLRDWALVAQKAPDVLFYAYTKEVEAAKDPQFLDHRPANMVLIFSLGGLQDDLVDRNHDRHDDVFASLEALQAAGYTDQAASDLMAPLLPTNRIGIVANRVPALVRRQGQRAFSELQAGGWAR